ncbi:YciI family protein [Corynebacterium choanae]|uniref:YciI-like protein n=1 Tax=Corynebacterium choanae TaxID=1862358 RepID=A0A3G6JCA4_9CORY|nr:YciI family protein [Corynebacterium choanae]AZA13794.1 YciI-like protein [Corynebacterium choanae]
MTCFAVLYTYNPASPRIAEIRPVHREFLSQLLADGKLVGSGPFTDTTGGALIVIRLDDNATVDDAEQLMNQDPFFTEKAIDSREIRPWNPVLNIFS